jgi:hypothetical protein
MTALGATPPFRGWTGVAGIVPVGNGGSATDSRLSPSQAPDHGWRPAGLTGIGGSCP